ncbi:MAG TPA: DUF1294 domain-containing protein [Anaerolineae bacterium]|nr:DUF1294 domain-containing protein [Anaerolineae bacterium]
MKNRARNQPARRAPAPTWWRNPQARFGLLSLGLTLLVGLAALVAGLAWWLVLLVMVLALNTMTLALYRYDKNIAGSGRMRVPENILLALAFFGGSPAAFVAIYQFEERHKTQKGPFLFRYWLIVTVQVLCLCSLPYWLGWL